MAFAVGRSVSRRWPLLIVALSVTGLLLAACGGGSTDDTGPDTGTTAALSPQSASDSATGAAPTDEPLPDVPRQIDFSELFDLLGEPEDLDDGLLAIVAERGRRGEAQRAREAAEADEPVSEPEPVPMAPPADDTDETPRLTPFGTETYLPEHVTETPDGRPIFRTEQVPVGWGFRWKTNFNIRTVDLAEISAGGPPRDGIPPIDAPKFVAVAEVVGIYADNAPVIQLEINGDVRAYPIGILIWHEIVNDVVGGVPVAVTFCPLCNTAIAFERTIDGEVFDFGTSGTLRNSDLVMWDRQTESLWQQIGGEAIVGAMVGAQLNLRPAPIVSWVQFKANFPGALVLSRDTGFMRTYGTNPYTGYDDVNNTPFLFRGELDSTLSPFERVVTLDLGDEFVAYPFPLLAEVRVFQDVRGQLDIAIFWTPGASSALDTRNIDEGREVGSTGVFVRTVDGESLDFAPNPADDQTFLDEQTGSTWNIFGKAVAGPLAGTQLEALVFANHFWFAWAAFQPDTEVVTG